MIQKFSGLTAGQLDGDNLATKVAPSYRRIWLCADDYGIAPGVNRAICDLIARGRLNATSVMTAAPSFNRNEAQALASLASGAHRAAIGLHVTLTAPFRPLTADYRPTRDGAFLSLGATLRSAFLRRLDPQALRSEIAAQLRGFDEAFGRPPDFIDGHQHVHLFPQARDAVLSVTQEMAPHAWLRQCGRASSLGVALNDRKGLFIDILSRSFRRRARSLGLRTNPAFAGTYNFTQPTEFAVLFPTFLSRMPDGGVVMCHPGFVDDELTRLDSLTAPREREYNYFSAKEFPEVLDSQGITLA